MWQGPQRFLTRHDNQLPSLSGVHGLKDFLCIDHLLESFYSGSYSLKHVYILWGQRLFSRVWQGPQRFLTRHDNQLPSLSGVHGLKDFFCIDHLLESFYGGSYSLKHFHKSTFHHKRTQEDGHYRENPSNHELLRVRGVDCRALLKMFGGLVTL